MAEELSNFDDDLFSSNSSITRANQSWTTLYTPKQCPPTWFLTSTTSDGLKFQADYNYASGRYEEAFKHYEKALPRMREASNLTGQRDCVEGMIRSRLRLGNGYNNKVASLLNDVVATARACEKESIRELQLRVARLKHSFHDEIAILREQLTEHPQNSNFWYRLGVAYSCKLVNHKTNEAEDAHSTMACFKQAKTLLETVENQPRFYNYAQNQRLLLQIQEQIANTNSSEQETKVLQISRIVAECSLTEDSSNS